MLSQPEGLVDAKNLDRQGMLCLIGMPESREQGSCFAHHVGTRNRPGGICVEHLVPAVSLFQPERLNLPFREGFQAFEEPPSQTGPLFGIELEDLGFQICDRHMASGRFCVQTDT